jgi:uncharacterized protein (DUF2225 family)
MSTYSDTESLVKSFIEREKNKKRKDDSQTLRDYLDIFQLLVLCSTTLNQHPSDITTPPQPAAKL